MLAYHATRAKRCMGVNMSLCSQEINSILVRTFTALVLRPPDIGTNFFTRLSWHALQDGHCFHARERKSRLSRVKVGEIVLLCSTTQEKGQNCEFFPLVD